MKKNLPNLQPFDDEGFYKVEKALYGNRGSPRYWKDAVAEAAEDLGLKPSKMDKSVYMDPGNFIQYVHVDDELLSGDDQLVRDMVEIHLRSWVGQWNEQNCRTDSSRRVQTLINVSKTWTWRSAIL